MNLNIGPACIEKMVSDAIVHSALGDKVKKAVLDTLSKSWNSPIDQAVAMTVEQVARDIVRTEHMDAIREAVKAKLTPEWIGTMVENVVEKVVRATY